MLTAVQLPPHRSDQRQEHVAPQAIQLGVKEPSLVFLRFGLPGGGRRPGSGIAHSSVFRVLQSAFRSLKLPNVTVRSFASPDGQRVQPVDRIFTVALKETPLGIDGACNYKNDLFDPDAIQGWIADYRSVLEHGGRKPPGAPSTKLLGR